MRQSKQIKWMYILLVFKVELFIWIILALINAQIPDRTTIYIPWNKFIENVQNLGFIIPLPTFVI